MIFKKITLTFDDMLARLILNYPQKCNALDEYMIAELIRACEIIAINSKIRVILLAAEGEHFCAGHLLDEMVDRSPAKYRYIFENCTAMMTSLRNLSQPIIAQIQGVATGAGCQLAATCDLVIASQDARFATPGVQIGLFCSTPAVPLVRAIGRKRALEMLLTGRWVNAQEAYAWGLANKVVPNETLPQEAKKLALQLAQVSPLTLALGKKVFYDQLEQSEPEALRMATSNMALNLCMEDAQEGIKAFLEKREPIWKGK